MKVDLFTLCEGAHNNNGHLTIVHTSDAFNVESFPSRLSFGLALKIYIKAQEEGEHILKVSIIDKQTGESIIHPIESRLHITKMDYASHIAIALNLQNVLFLHSGVYDIHLETEDKRLDDFAFEVISHE